MEQVKTRRGFLGLLGAVTSGAVSYALLSDGSSAARRGQSAPTVEAIPGGVTFPILGARRPTPTPTPARCPGIQVAVGGVCTCPAGPTPFKCGPDCCWSEAACCDNACCLPGTICDPNQEEVCIPAA